jgi:hypothetical protein
LFYRVYNKVMSKQLPRLVRADLGPTRDCLQDAALAIGSLQRAFLPKHPRQWQYGLEVTMRGISTQAFMVAGEETRAGLDLVRGKLRLGNEHWMLKDCYGPAAMKIFRDWLAGKGVEAELEEPKFKAGGQQMEKAQVEAYAEALWWLDGRFRTLKASLDEGVTSPILLYPHHFDLSLVWFPHDDEQQLALGFSTGDGNVPEPYLYLTAYPEPDGFTAIELAAGAYWQEEGFSGAVLPYAELQASADPEALFDQFAGRMFAAARPLFD